ncbi:hypothetical protein BN1088_1220006 [Sphingobacterium sp. PM2-P1-29]|nr:hypothetical protein BN1088_1220006 [Sphingobacterium sp. PM2-P1-29]
MLSLQEKYIRINYEYNNLKTVYLRKIRLQLKTQFLLKNEVF